MDPDQTQDPTQDAPKVPDAEAMEQIRQRRVAKLGGSSTPKSPAATPSNPTPVAFNVGMAQDSTAETSAVPVPQSNPFAQLGIRGTAAKDIQAQEAPAAAASIKRHQAEAGLDQAASPPTRQPRVVNEKSFGDFTDRVLSGIFRITPDPSHTEDRMGHKLLHLAGLQQELEDADEPLRLTWENLDSALLEACSSVPHNKSVMDYLLPCWKRVVDAMSNLRRPSEDKLALLKEAKRLCMSNCIFALTMPELFGRESDAKVDYLATHLLLDPMSERGIDLNFFAEALSRIDEDENVAPMFTNAMVQLSEELSAMTMNEDYRAYANALTAYSKFPQLLDALAQHERFLPKVTAPEIETQSVLGPFFRISPLQTEVTKVYYPGPKTLDQARIKQAHEALQNTLRAYQSILLDVINGFVRAGATAKSRTLDWFGYIVNTNHKRRALQVNTKEVSSDGFMMNVTVILDGLCSPFMTTTFEKVSRIDVEYLRREPRVDISDETKLNADKSKSDEYYSHKAAGTSNFISEVFFLNLAAHHYGSEATTAKLKSLERDIKFYEKQLAQIEAERPKFASHPNLMVRFEESVRRHREILEKSMCLKHAIEGLLLDAQMQSRSLLFMRYTTVWLLRVASGANYTPVEPKLHLPFAEKEPEAFSCLPEYVLQDIVDNFKFIFRYLPQIMISAVGDEVIALCLAFLRSSEYIKNPYLKASLVSLLFFGTWPIYHLKKGVLGDALMGSDFANEHLLHALMKFYIEAESTGAHTQFYDKFNIRYEIFQVIKCVWENDVYKRQLTRESRANKPFFIRFVNLLLNDATYVLDEALTRFPKIHDLQHDLRDTNLSAQDRQKKEEELQTAEGQAQSYMQLANETVAMMKLFTAALSEAFTMPEIVRRLADMMDFNLDLLVGPKQANLKVENPDKYHFQPKTLLGELVDIYLNLGSSQAFVEAVASDGRSYKPANFDSCSRILGRFNIKSPQDLAAWDALKKRFLEAKEAAEQVEMDLGDIPPEFEDPIMGDLMRDPVILPSKHIVDRSTIVQHLLSDPKDPFTRQPMTIEDVIPETELRTKIDEWITQKRSAASHAALTEAAEASLVESMDTTEG